MACYVARRTAPFTVLLVVLTALVLPLRATAQRPGYVPRIVVLDLGLPPPPAEPSPFLDAFRHELHKRGWVEGHTSAMLKHRTPWQSQEGQG